MDKSTFKNKGNDIFKTKTNNIINFKKLISAGYIVEINNVLFVFDQRTSLWVVANADYAFLSIPKYDNTNERLWNLLHYKTTISGKYKPKSKILGNTFELSKEQINEVMKLTYERSINFKDIYDIFKEKYHLPKYKLGD